MTPEPGTPVSPTPPASRARLRRRMRLAAIAVALGLALVVAEVGLRLSQVTRVARSDRDTWHEFDEVLGWRARASWSGTGSLPTAVPDASTPAPPDVVFRVRTNALGLRHDREVAPAPAPGTDRIAFVGDSFVFGYGVEVDDGVVARLEAALRTARAPGARDVEVLNLGTCAYGVDQMRLVVERQALDLQPRLVLVGLIDQDLRRAGRSVSITGQRKPRFVLGDGPADDPGVRLVGVPVPPPPAAGELMLADRPPEGGSFLLWRISDLVERARVALAGGAEGARMRWRVGAALLRDAARLCRARGVAFGVVLFPTPVGFAEGDPLRPLLAGLGPEVPALDLYPAYEAVPDRAALFLHDGHPSARGHALSADAIARWITEQRLTERP